MEVNQFNLNVNFQLTNFTEKVYYYKSSRNRFSKTLTVPEQYKDSFILTKKDEIYVFSTPYVFNEDSVIVIGDLEFYPSIFLLNQDEELYYCVLTLV